MHQAAAPDSEVLPEDFAIPETPKAANPYGANNKVAFQKGWVRLDGAFTADQLVAFAGPFEEREEVVRGRRDRVMGVMSPIRGQAAEAVKGILERDPKSIGGHRVTPRAGTPESKSAAPESAIGLGRACEREMVGAIRRSGPPAAHSGSRTSIPVGPRRSRLAPGQTVNSFPAPAATT
jgi:hypothetical protein